MRPTEATKRGVALRVGLAAKGSNLYVAQVVGIVAMEYGAIGHRPRQVGAEAAVDRHLQFQGCDATGVVISHVILVGEWMALASDQKIFIPV